MKPQAGEPHDCGDTCHPLRARDGVSPACGDHCRRPMNHPGLCERIEGNRTPMTSNQQPTTTNDRPDQPPGEINVGQWAATQISRLSGYLAQRFLVELASPGEQTTMDITLQLLDELHERRRVAAADADTSHHRISHAVQQDLRAIGADQAAAAGLEHVRVAAIMLAETIDAITGTIAEFTDVQVITDTHRALLHHMELLRRNAREQQRIDPLTMWRVHHPGIGVITYGSEQTARAAAGTAGTIYPPGVDHRGQPAEPATGDPDDDQPLA